MAINIYRGFTLERASRGMLWTIKRDGMFMGEQSTVSRVYAWIDDFLKLECASHHPHCECSTCLDNRKNVRSAS